MPSSYAQLAHDSIHFSSQHIIIIIAFYSISFHLSLRPAL